MQDRLGGEFRCRQGDGFAANGEAVALKKVDGPVSAGALAVGIQGYETHSLTRVEPNGLERVQCSRRRSTPIAEDDRGTGPGPRWRDDDHRPGTSSQHLQKAPNHRAPRSDVDLRRPTDQDDVTALRLQGDLS